MTKSRLIAILFFQVIFASFYLGQSISLDWARQLTGGGRNYVYDLHVTPQQEILIGGRYSGAVDLDPGAGVFSITTGTIPNKWEPYISKLDSSGNFLWGFGFSCITTAQSSSDCSSIVTDNIGNVYVAGTFKDTLDFDPGIGSFTMDPGGGCVFICKLTSSGQFVWAKQFGDTMGLTSGSRLTIDKQNNLIIAGLYYGQADFDPGPSQFIMTSVGFSDVFVSKLTNNGVFMWAMSVGGTGYEGWINISVDPASDIVFVNSFQGTVDFDPGAGTHTLNTTSGQMAVVKISSAGNFLFAKQFEGVLIDDLNVDLFGNIYLAGGFKGISNISTGPGTYTVASAGNHDGFVSKLDNSGNFLWGQIVGGAGDDFARALSVDADRNVYLTGQFEQIADFGPGQLTYTVASVGLEDTFITQYDSIGSLTWARAIGGISADLATKIVTAPFNRFYLSGYFFQGCDFDPNPASNILSTAPKQYEGFVAKYSPCPVSVCGGVGIEEFKTSEISIYPNPSSDRIYLKLDNDCRIVLFDVLGKQLGEYNLQRGVNTIPVNQLTAGLYFIQVENYNERIKFVKE